MARIRLEYKIEGVRLASIVDHEPANLVDEEEMDVINVYVIGSREEIDITRVVHQLHADSTIEDECWKALDQLKKGPKE